MVAPLKRLAVLGSTGSIGTQTLDIVRTFPDRFRVTALAAGRRVDSLEAQVREFRPTMVYCQGGPPALSRVLSDYCRETRMEEMVRDDQVDLVVTATVGDVALRPTLEALSAGKDVALGNKESVVMAGRQITETAARTSGSILPIDSEPSAIWQCIRGEEQAIARLIITASGGPFRDWPIGRLAGVTPKEALAHPTWTMGSKITVDSATLMNKAFEVIESHWLFGVPWEDIEVVVHPQSIIHSMVEFVDGSVKAQLGLPDMRLPIQYALFYPERVRNERIPRFDAVRAKALTFEPLDLDKYPCFSLALEVARRGGTWPAALSGADDAAVALFLSGRIGFAEIATLIREVLEGHDPSYDPSTGDLLTAAEWARTAAYSIVEG